MNSSATTGDRNCPCHSGRSYAECCRQYHEGELPKTASALMRSRYAAYALQLADYLIQTTHPKNKQYSKNTVAWKQSIQQFCANTHFVSLTILDEKQSGNNATVTFRAGLVQNLKDSSFTERSNFCKQNGKWLYLTGEILDGDKFQL